MCSPETMQAIDEAYDAIYETLRFRTKQVNSLSKEKTELLEKLNNAKRDFFYLSRVAIALGYSPCSMCKSLGSCQKQDECRLGTGGFSLFSWRIE